jgi:hypothetical protein
MQVLSGRAHKKCREIVNGYEKIGIDEEGEVKSVGKSYRWGDRCAASFAS